MALRFRSSGIAVAAVMLSVLLAVTLLPTRQASASGCSHDNWRDDMVWSDHYWQGWGNTLTWTSLALSIVTIQRVDIGFLGLGARSGVDGYYGSKTHLDVEDVQDLWGVTSGWAGRNDFLGSLGDNYVTWRRTDASGVSYWGFHGLCAHNGTLQVGLLVGAQEACDRKAGFRRLEKYSVWLGLGCAI